MFCKVVLQEFYLKEPRADPGKAKTLILIKLRAVFRFQLISSRDHLKCE